ncbi:hypothetical protein WDV93_12110 [Pantoea ananatis]
MGIYASGFIRHCVNAYDELSSVAQAFDAMVERLDMLVKAREALLHDINELRLTACRRYGLPGPARQRPENVSTSLDRIDEEAHLA